MKRQRHDDIAPKEAGCEPGLMDGMTEAEWRLHQLMEAVGQQAELHEIRIEDVKLRTEHLKAERQKRAKINAAEYKGVWPR